MVVQNVGLMGAVANGVLTITVKLSSVAHLSAKS